MKNSINTILQKLKQNYKYRKLTHFMLNKLGRFGIQITPYIVYQESIPRIDPSDVGSDFKNYKIMFLQHEDMGKIANIKGHGVSEKELLKRLEIGNICLAVKKQNKIVAFSWCNLDVLDLFPDIRIKLLANEAYLFDAYTIKSHRGNNLAPFMRQNYYQKLSRIGRDILYSFTDYFNTPAVRFKVKLGARRLRLCLYIRLFKKKSWHWQLKKYDEIISDPIVNKIK